MTEIGTGVWQHSNVWSGTGLTATYDPKGLHLHVTDPLGTRRVQLNAQGAVEGTCQNLPFGDALTCTPTALSTADDATEQHFTGKEYDAESGNDYFLARYYGSSMGRFMSPDWSATPDTVPYADFRLPQTLNLYTYADNNPLVFGDSSGHVTQVCDASGKNCSNMSDSTFDKDKAADQKKGEYFQNGTMFHMDADGNKVTDGTYSWKGPDLPGDEASNQAGANMIGNGGMGMVNLFMKNMAYTVAGGLAGRAIGYGWEAASNWALLNSGDTVVYQSINAAGEVQYVGITG